MLHLFFIIALVKAHFNSNSIKGNENTCHTSCAQTMFIFPNKSQAHDTWSILNLRKKKNMEFTTYV